MAPTWLRFQAPTLKAGEPRVLLLNLRDESAAGANLTLLSICVSCIVLCKKTMQVLVAKPVMLRPLPFRRLARLPFGPYLGLQARGLGLALGPLPLQSLPVRGLFRAQLLHNFVAHALELRLGLSTKSLDARDHGLELPDGLAQNTHVLPRRIPGFVRGSFLLEPLDRRRRRLSWVTG